MNGQLTTQDVSAAFLRCAQQRAEKTHTEGTRRQGYLDLKTEILNPFELDLIGRRDLAELAMDEVAEKMFIVVEYAALEDNRLNVVWSLHS